MKKVMFENATPVRLGLIKRYKLWFLSAPILIYTPGKVGSSTIANSLRKLNISEVQPHSLRYSMPGIYFVKPKFTLAQRRYYAARSFLLNMKTYFFKYANKNNRIRMVVLVRSPAVRNISAFFEHFHHLNLGAVNKFSANEIENLFYKYGFHDAQEKWLDDEIGEIFGVDLYESAFEKGKALTITKSELDLFFIRLEDLSGSWKILSDCLGLKDMQMEPTNRSEYKKYAELYKETKNLVLENKEYLESIENTKFFEKFYREEVS